MNLISGTLYAKYIKERLGYEIVENEQSFVIYKMNGKECFIVDMFVEPSERAKGAGHKLQLSLEEIAKKQGAEFLSANIYSWDSGATNTLTASFKTGFKLGPAQNGIVSIVKNLLGG